MLKIKDNVDLKELKKYHIYPHYTVDEYTGVSHIDYYETTRLSFQGIRLVRKKHIIAFKKYQKQDELIIDEKAFGELNCDILYDLIKADLVEKVSIK